MKTTSVFCYDRQRGVDVAVRENYDMQRPVNLCLVKCARWVTNGRAFHSRWPCSGRGCRRPWAELGWAGLAVSQIFTVHSPDSKKTQVSVSL